MQQYIYGNEIQFWNANAPIDWEQNNYKERLGIIRDIQQSKDRSTFKKWFHVNC